MSTELQQPVQVTPASSPPDEVTAAAREAVEAINATNSAPTEAPAPSEDKKRADVLHSQEALEARDRHILAALDEMLERRQAPQPVRRPPMQEESSIERFVLGMVRKGAGIVSLSMVLIFMGIVVLYCFFSETADMLLPLKLSPVAAILLGLEIFVYHLASGKKFRIHIPAIIITALIIAGCCTMAVVMNKSYTQSKEEFNNRTIAAQIYESGYHELRLAAQIKEIEVFVDLNPDGSARTEGIDSLSTDDTVILTVTFSGSYKEPEDFVRECRTVIDAYRFLDIPVTEFHFVSDGKFNSYRLNVEGLFMQEFTEAELIAQTSHVYVEDFDYIDDLDDFVGETVETFENE